jgi:hypothetical protein
MPYEDRSAAKWGFATTILVGLLMIVAFVGWVWWVFREWD